MYYQSKGYCNSCGCCGKRLSASPIQDRQEEKRDRAKKVSRKFRGGSQQLIILFIKYTWLKRAGCWVTLQMQNYSIVAGLLSCPMLCISIVSLKKKNEQARKYQAKATKLNMKWETHLKFIHFSGLYNSMVPMKPMMLLLIIWCPICTRI